MPAINAGMTFSEGCWRSLDTGEALHLVALPYLIEANDLPYWQGIERSPSGRPWRAGAEETLNRA
jgi:hypothetical protein